MGYNISRNAFVRNRPQLEELIRAKTSVRFVSENPGKLAYQLREAMHSANAYPEFMPYHGLNEKFRLIAEKDCLVAIRILPQNDLVTEVIHEGGVEIPDLPVSDRDDNLFKETVVGNMELMEIMASTLNLGEHFDEIHMPDVQLDKEERLTLYTWALSKQWKLIDHEGNGITLTQREVPKEILWKPEGDESNG